jgi:tetratricopeptide (TPR) repeat protein
MTRIAAGGPNAGPAREALVAGCLARFRWADAQRLLKAWLAAEPDDPTALLLTGKLQEQRLDLNGATAAYRRVVELDPDHDEARTRLATVLVGRFYGEEALGHLEVLRRRLPGHPEVTYLWAVALGLQGRGEEAKSALDPLLEQYPNHPRALAERARYAALAGDYAGACVDLARSVRLDPGNVAARNQYAQALERAGDRAGAERETATAGRLKTDLETISQLVSGPLQNRPDDPDVPYQIAVIALRAGQPEEGLRWLRAALQVDPDYRPAHQALAAYYQAAGNPVLAARHRAAATRPAGPNSP